MKNKKHVAFHNANEVFGGSNDAVFRLDWILPTNISYPPACKYEILGYMNPYETEHEVSLINPTFLLSLTCSLPGLLHIRYLLANQIVIMVLKW